MKALRHSVLIRFLLVPFTLTLSLGACTSYVAMERPYAQSIQEEADGKVRVSLVDGERTTVALPRVESDSMFGFQADSWDQRTRHYTEGWSASIPEISSVERKTFDPWNSLTLALGIVGGLMLAWVIDCSGEDSLGCF